MKNFNNSNKFGRSRGGYNSEDRGSSRPHFGSGSAGRNQMHDAVCADCGGNCKVPFMPSSGKPVYCSNCFEKRGNGDHSARKSSFSSKSFTSKSFTPAHNKTQENFSKQFELINTKLDKIIRHLNLEEVAKTTKTQEIFTMIGKKVAKAKTKKESIV
ncbi:MAG: hypothetical protein H6772_01765 [Pseudomonadales bacterium]|nr:hypothetical protein [Pseudomonadales bacterium]